MKIFYLYLTVITVRQEQEPALHLQRDMPTNMSYLWMGICLYIQKIWQKFWHVIMNLLVEGFQEQMTPGCFRLMKKMEESM